MYLFLKTFAHRKTLTSTQKVKFIISSEKAKLESKKAKQRLKENNIDLVVHGFANDNDWEKQQDFFKYLIENNKFKKINYYDKISTTDIINNIKRNY